DEVVKGEMMMKIDVWLYGPLARYGNGEDNIFANPQVEMPAGSTIRDLLTQLSMPTALRGISFINGNLSAMPGVQPDLDHVLNDGDRVALFHLKSMWPFQYRHDVAAIKEFKTSLENRADSGFRSRYD
ncbi:MAG: MoaD/ThiS family protein, partial [Smithellaceae bacterium]|nr:MoaD/ThiS family protein [Smithellaceae bacterium]